jgi:hypothetical protein
MLSNIEKLIFGGLVGFHVFWLFIGFMVGEGILFGTRYFDNTIRIFTGIEILLSFVAVGFIYKNNRIGYVFFTISVITTYVIGLGHWMGFWYCSYCQY